MKRVDQDSIRENDFTVKQISNKTSRIGDNDSLLVLKIRARFVKIRNNS